jgi:TRAP-type C4-dicarboxylate transport system permease small subunit
MSAEVRTELAADAEPHPLDQLPPLPGFLNWPDRMLSRIEDSALTIAAVALTVTMLTIVVDVFMRYVFNSPLQWSYEVVSDYLIPFAVFLAMADTLRRGEHIEVDFFLRLLTPRVRFWFRRINAAIAAVVFVLLVTVVGQEAWRAIGIWEMSVGNYTLPLWLSKLSAPIGLGLLTLRVLIQIVGDSRIRDLR